MLPLSSGADPDYQSSSADLYQVTLHELGHAIGLAHSTDANAVMYPYAGASNRDLDPSDIAGVKALYGSPPFAMTDSETGVSTDPKGDTYTGPVSYLQKQFIYTGSDDIAVSANVPNVFIHGGSGNDAIEVGSGNNVIDGGQGSNFLVGGTGDDTFFLDARGGQATWGTLVNFHAGDAGNYLGLRSVRLDQVLGRNGRRVRLHRPDVACNARWHYLLSYLH